MSELKRVMSNILNKHSQNEKLCHSNISSKTVK